MSICSVDGCSDRIHSAGFCNRHYKRWKRTGRPEGRRVLDERFWSKVVRRGNNECWEWAGGHDTAGYGRFHVNQERRHAGAHCVAYELLIGPLPEGLEPDHICCNKGCVNPYHLELVTHGENVIRGIKVKPRKHKTHCPKGHTLSGENLYVYTDRDGKISHLCRECRRARCRVYKARRSA